MAAALLAAIPVSPKSADAYVGLCCGKCGGNMPMNIPGGGIPETHEFRFKIQPMQMHMSGLRSGTNDVAPASILGMPAAGKYMAAPTSMDMRMLSLSAGYSFTDDFFAGVMGMYGENDMDMQFSSMMQTTTGVAGYTMKSKGLMDTMLMTKYRIYADDTLIPTQQASLFLGLSMPTGSIDKRNTAHPLAMRRTELLPYAMQMGSGTWDPIVGALFQGSSSPWWWGADARYTVRAGNNKRGYHLGNRTQLDAYVMYQPHYALLLYGQINGDIIGKIKGEADEAVSGASGHATQGSATSTYMTPMWDPASIGKKQIFATLGVQWQPMPLQIVDIGVQLPLYQRMDGLQMKDKWRLMLSWYVEIPTSKSIRATGKSTGPSDLGF
ncbi:MAG: hypothetical protein COW19_02625 [Zetaproteobacteria bacterium CG12_big_fil_rev_8_21_14_0_65_55_1124]|nr:MAG: hypothetical protein AUJ58_08400 [Zetaproteobacteria bacterium CG1_02_55_237]PIS19716.1 MAG: hypothetical protein COT53_04130 [Zetaproteobacteria bacterium CG08_land_8_20_14_0_20_55_17]PIW43482.1 MAG: hypothetical protein COW19_02625 [Zetaproteobacteria bacterium CG12_big_fil_rev_8_21_14_0_65_55_1124]PIY54114.1 MAG: hypothetical protein COZ01_01405 [Zetaproteobacteria bacterium CG_4_10_14_0_8_um_filter_55_43]PIZ39107.1 MAG: hypothetical protein COY36_03885 [Zetaproteobacteria bacterium 